MTETVEKTDKGAILYDRQVMREISEDRFGATGWLHAEPVEGALRAAGRGNTMFVGNVPRQFVLRHYLRGGLIGKIVRDVYVWAGEDPTRPFLACRMLAKMADSGLRVPRPAAARYRRLGAAVQDFHEKGVFHADMNAYNLQIDKDGDLWMLDFDRGRLLPPGPWQQKTLSRLHRSLQKIVSLDPRLHFRTQNWEQFLEGYFDASRSA
jgi:3-deoxy-D-manno-octulosonic acid kinase